MLRSDSTVKTLNQYVVGVRKRQWIYMHVHHPENKHIGKAGGMFSLHVMLHTALCVLTPRGLAVSLSSAVNRTHISGNEAATAVLSSDDITVEDLKCNLGQWRYWPTQGQKGQQWGPFPGWSLMKRSLLWHKSWSDEDQRKLKTSPSRHILNAIASITLGPSRREAPVSGDGVTLITTSETDSDGTVYAGISLHVSTITSMSCSPQKRLLDMEFDLIFLDAKLVDDAGSVVPEWLWNVVKQRDTVCYGDPAMIGPINDGLQAWADGGDTQFHCWTLPCFAYKRSPQPGDEFKTEQASVCIWSAKTLPTMVCPVCMYHRHVDVHSDTARPRRVLCFHCPLYTHSYRRSSPLAARK